MLLLVHKAQIFPPRCWQRMTNIIVVTIAATATLRLLPLLLLWSFRPR
jgi:hypothetical protein